MYHRLQIRLLRQLTKDVGHIKQRSTSASPGMIDTTAKAEPVPETAADDEDRATLFDEVQSLAAETEHGQGPAVAPGQTPDERYRRHQQTRQKPVTQKKATSEVKAYTEFAAGALLPADSQDGLNAYKKHLLAARPALAPGTMNTKFMHISKWLKEAYGKKFHTSWFAGAAEQTRPHKAYAEPDILQLVEALRGQPRAPFAAEGSAEPQRAEGK